MAAAPDLPWVASAQVASGSTVSLNASVPNGDNYLILCEGNRVSGSTAGPPSSITFNGIAMTQVPGSSVSSGATTSIEASAWYLANPPIGTYPILVTYASATSGAGVIAVPCSGVVGFGTPVGASSQLSNSPAVSVGGADEFAFYLGAAFNGNTSQAPTGPGQYDLATLSGINSANSFSASWESLLSASGAFAWNPTGSSNITRWVATAVAVLGLDVQASVPRASPSASAAF